MSWIYTQEYYTAIVVKKMVVSMVMWIDLNNNLYFFKKENEVSSIIPYMQIERCTYKKQLHGRQ